MISERLLTGFLRHANKRYLALEAVSSPELAAPKPGKEYLLYAHVPFCERLCPYCSFNRYPFDEPAARTYFKNLRAEMRSVAAAGYDCTSMYVGGGTPTVLVDELVETIELARSLFRIREVSTETNPNHLIPRVIDPLDGLVQRFSVGVQSFDDTLLRQMDRYEKYGSSAEILKAIERTIGRFQLLNVDLIFNFPSQTAAMLDADVDLLKSTGAEQVTFYPLMASPVVRRSLRASVGRVDYTREGQYYQRLSARLAPEFEASSAWCFSRTGQSMIDEYIVDYDEYIGVGSGAFSYLDGRIYANTFSLRAYDAAIAAGQSTVSGHRAFSRREQMRYRFLMDLFGLRLEKTAFERRFGVSVEKGLPLEMAYMRSVGAFEADTATEITLTPKGRYLCVVMMREFFSGVNQLRDHMRQALPSDERELLFGEGRRACVDADNVLVEAAIETRHAHEGDPIPGQKH